LVNIVFPANAEIWLEDDESEQLLRLCQLLSIIAATEGKKIIIEKIACSHIESK
jgi:hypothetical protein